MATTKTISYAIRDRLKLENKPDQIQNSQNTKPYELCTTTTTKNAVLRRNE